MNVSCVRLVNVTDLEDGVYLKSFVGLRYNDIYLFSAYAIKIYVKLVGVIDLKEDV